MLPVIRFKWTHTNCYFLMCKIGKELFQRHSYFSDMYYWTKLRLMYLGFRFEQPGCDWNFEQFQECSTILLTSRNFQWWCLFISQKPIFKHPSKATSSLKNLQPNLTWNLKRDIFIEVSCRLCDIQFRVTFAFGKTCFFGRARTIVFIVTAICQRTHRPRQS